MKSCTVRLSFAAAVAVASLSAVAADNGFYAYGSAGWTESNRKSEADGVVSNLAAAHPPTSFTSSYDGNDTGYKLQAGYRFNRFIAIEGGYVDLGKYNYKAATSGLVTATRDVEVKADGWTLGAVGSLPVTDSLAFIGKVGLVDYKMQHHCNGTGFPCINPDRSKSDTSLYYGIGADWNFTGNWFARAEYEVFQDVGDRSNANGTTGTSKADISMGSIGVGYRF
jgi:OmpA-OmpF porin, OOP family